MSLMKTSRLKVKRLLELLPHIEVSGGLVKIRNQENLGGKWRVICFETLQEPVAWEAHKQRYTGIDSETKRIQAEWY